MTDDEKTLIAKAQQGQTWAFEKLVRQYDRRVLDIAMRITQNPQDAEDIFQEVWLRVHQNIGQFRYGSAFYTWLYRITLNTAVSSMKSRKRTQYRPVEEILASCPSGEARPDAALHQEELHERIQNGLDRLSMKQRVIFTLKHYEDFKIKDIAEIVSCSEGTVKNSLFRSAEKMRRALAGYAS
ncbi:MAG TPA: RNA polymerase sigma factor [bacterium]|nr:RNA polymerase sigma factor [bacterium]